MGLAVPHLRAQGGGVIINVSSDAGEMVDHRFSGRPDDSPGNPLGAMLGYASTKAALNRLTNALAPDLARDNIAAICVDPGFTRTELVDLMGARGLVDPEGAHSMDLPVETILDLITAENPLVRSGQVIHVGSPAGRAAGH